MSEGGEEKAVFVALKNDAEQALPKIAEKNASLVEDTVDRGAQSLEKHAANEADLEGKMNALATKPEQPFKPANPADGENLVKGTKVQQSLTQDNGEIDNLAKPQFGNAALKDSPNYNDQIDKALDGTGISRAEYDRLRLTPTNDLSPEDLQKVATIRNQIQIQDGQMVSKVLHPDVVNRYMSNTHVDGGFQADQFGGSIARGTDTADLTTPAQLRDGLALDDHGQGWTPIKPDATEAYQLRFHAPDGLGDKSPISYGAVGDTRVDPSLQGQANDVATTATGHATTGSVMADPYTGTGYTAGGVPEWLAPRGSDLPGRAEIWQVTPDGQEQMIGYFNKGSWAAVNG